MGNSAGKNGDAYDDLAGRASADLTEREAASAWYRYGVDVTDVYDVIEVLGRGHMGEVFTVRRKTSGHHNDATRERSSSSSCGGGEDDGGGKVGAPLAILGTPPPRRQKSSSSTTTSTSYGTEPSSPACPARRRKTIGGVVHKTRKVIAKQTSKAGGGRGKDDKKCGHATDVGSDSDLTSFIDRRDDAIEGGQHEPPKSPAKPAKSIMKERTSMHYQSKDAISSSSDAGPPPTRNDASTTSLNSDITNMSIANSSSDVSASTPPPPVGPRYRTLTSESVRSIERANKGVHFQRTFAVKTITTSRINTTDVQELVNEIMIMRKLDHPYVLKLYEVYHVKRKLWLVTELCTGGDLSARKLNEHDAKNVIEQILRALVYLHRMGIVHRDIKLENVLYENNCKGSTVRLIDFGLSRMFDRAALATDYTRCPYTMSPETASMISSSKDGRVKGENITDKTDVWAVGVVTFVILSGEFPFIKTSANLKDKYMMDRLKRADFDFGCTWNGRGITMQARRFVEGCLQADPSRRWTSKQALDFVQKVWGAEVDKIWNEWKAKNMKVEEPEFDVSPDLPDDDAYDSSSDEANSEVSNASMHEENDIDVNQSPAVCEARAKNISKHVSKVIKAKKAEKPTTDEEGNAEIDLDEIERYTKYGLLKKTILITMANTMDRSDMGKLREIFLQADTENTGTITMQELLSSVRRVSPDIDEKRTKDLFSGIDRDKSGHIHYAEFLAALAESHGLVTLNRLSEAFDRIDTDGKGWIGHEDLKRILGKDYDKETVDKMIEEGDFKKNGKVDYEELLQLMFSDPAKGAEMVNSLTGPSKISGGNWNK